MRVESICSIDALSALTPQWLSLWEHCPNASPFQYPGWLSAWWRHFGERKTLHVLVAWENGALKGILPLCVLEDGRWVPVGIGLGDYLDLLAAPEHARAVAAALLGHLVEELWATCEFEPLLRESPLLDAPTSRGIASEVFPVETLTHLELPDAWGEYESRLSSHFLERIADAERRAKSLGALCFEQSIELDVLLHFRQARWRDLNERIWRFHKESAEAFRAGGMLRLWTLRVGERIAAMLYGFVHRRRGYFYMTGFDPELGKISPGTLLIKQALNALMEEGVGVCEFLRGREPFKYRWGVVERQSYCRRLLRTP